MRKLKSSLYHLNNKIFNYLSQVERVRGSHKKQLKQELRNEICSTQSERFMNILGKFAANLCGALMLSLPKWAFPEWPSLWARKNRH